jgi:DNA-binding NtrC family response regulator
MEEMREKEKPATPRLGAVSEEHLSAPPLIGESSALRKLRRLIRCVGPRQCTVLITGESGTGKELVARHVHAASPRSAGPFVPVECTALHESVVESQLFGHARGAFTGADHATVGFIRAAHGGTLFLDEVGDLLPAIQAKFLRCIQEHEVVPLGSVTPVPVDVRIIAATHRNLRSLVRQETFREDLYYRLEVAELHVSPLRARREDVAPLVEHFLDVQANLYREPRRSFTPAALAALEAFDWPGNVRQLANAIEHACVFCPDPLIGPEYIPWEDSVAPTAPDREFPPVLCPWTSPSACSLSAPCGRAVAVRPGRRSCWDLTVAGCTARCSTTGFTTSHVAGAACTAWPSDFAFGASAALTVERGCARQRRVPFRYPVRFWYSGHWLRGRRSLRGRMSLARHLWYYRPK